MHLSARSCIALVLGLLALAAPAPADPGMPVGVTWWGGPSVTIETFWGFRVGVMPQSATIEPGAMGELDLVIGMPPEPGSSPYAGNPPIEQPYHDAKSARIRRFGATLDRMPNDKQLVVPSGKRKFSSNALQVRTVPSTSPVQDNEGALPQPLVVVNVDGVRIVHCVELGAELWSDVAERLGDVDLLIIQVESPQLLPPKGTTASVQQALETIKVVKPRMVLPLVSGPDAHKVIDRLAQGLPERFKVRATGHSTLAICQGTEPTREHPWMVVLEPGPWQPGEELAAFIDAKERSCAKSQDVFRPLRADQMNHRPSNGTHTARWNVEHMSGTELFVFSNIYSNIDPAIPPIRNMPNQMPPDYEPREPSWTGEEEALHMQRVADFTRRFAYLVEDVDLESLPAGTPQFMGSLGGAFNRMRDHYAEHTEHVVKKFDLEDWPQ